MASEGNQDLPSPDQDASTDDDGTGLLVHSIFGRQGQVQPRKSLVWDHGAEAKPFENPHEISWSIALPTETLLRLLHGYSPATMDHKWWILSSGPDAHGAAHVHFHRSWGGDQTARLNIVIEQPEDPGGLWTGQVHSLTLEKNPPETSAEDDTEFDDFVKFQVAVVCRVVLSIDLVKPIPKSKIWDSLLSNAANVQTRADERVPDSASEEKGKPLYRAVNPSAETDEDMRPFLGPDGFHGLPQGTTLSFGRA